MDTGVVKEFQNVLEEMGLITSPNPTFGIPIGTFRLDDDPKLTAHICNRVAENTKAFWTLAQFKHVQNQSAQKPVAPKPESPEWHPESYKDIPPQLIAKHGVKKATKLVAAFNYTQAQKEYDFALLKYAKLKKIIQNVRKTNDYSNNGYVRAIQILLEMHFPKFVREFFSVSRELTVSENARQKHTFICAGSGGGKSESMKHFIRWHIQEQVQAALVILDPHGDLANDIARFEGHAHNDKLLYIQPHLFDDHFPAFNPFDILSGVQDSVRLNVAQKRFLEALEIIVGEKFSPAQTALLTPCLGVILHKENANFSDLVTFMDDAKNQNLVEYGATFLPNASDREFFSGQFNLKNFEATKAALGYRFYELFRNPIIKQFLCSPSTFNLDEALNQRKVICFGFDPDLVDEDAITTIGQFINAYLVSFAMGRPRGKSRFPIHLFNDECHYFVTRTVKKVLKETRKFGLHITMATQDINDLGSEIRKAIFTNVGCYLVGRNKSDCAELMAKEQRVISADDIRSLPELSFYQIDLERTPVKVKIEYLGDRFAMDEDSWFKLLEQQKAKFYRLVDEEAKAAADVKTNNRHTRRLKKNPGPMFDGPDFSQTDSGADS